VPTALEAVCLKAMAHRPEDGFDSPSGLADELERWLAGGPVRSWREPLRMRARRWVSRHRTLTTATVAALAVTVVGLAIGLRRERSYNQNLYAVNRRLVEEK